MLILLDNGHGIETPGKRSPIWKDGRQLFEYKFNRNIVRKIAEELQRCGIKYKVIVPELNDISLRERCDRVNKICASNGDENVRLISVHSNAGGGTGFEAYTSRGVTKADRMATIIYEEAEKTLAGFKMRKDWTDGDADKEAGFYILKHTGCPSVLTENLFMDNKKDCDFLMSENGKQKIANFHVNAIKRMNKAY